jgi:hypothetical protein
MKLGVSIGAGLAAAALATAVPASAANRYASPTGSADPVATLCANALSPCSIENAYDMAADGDDVTLLGGVPPNPPYVVTSELVTGSTVDSVVMHGAPGARPVIETSATDGVRVGSGEVLRDVVVEHTGSGLGVNAFYTSEGQLERVSVHSAGTAACYMSAPSSLRDTVCWYTGSDPNGGAVVANTSATTSTDLRNVTAIATQPGMPAIRVKATSFAFSPTASGVIADGDPDILAQDGPNPAYLAGATLDHSNYATVVHGGGVVTPAGTGTNQMAPPVFANAGAGDFHQLAGSTATIDLGFSGLGMQALGTFDIDGQPRTIGAAPDIGADEFQPAPPTPVVTAPPPFDLRAALKKCKKKKSKKARKKCIKRAKKLAAA